MLNVQNNRLNRRVIGAVSVLLVAAGTAANAQVTYSPVALTGTDGPLGPGLGAGVRFLDLGSAVAGLNNDGHVVFRADTTQTTNFSGVWQYNGFSNGVVAQAGNPSPAGGVYPSAGFNLPMINNAGQMAWRQGTNSIFSNSGGSDGLIMITGAGTPAAPGTGGATFGSLGTPSPFFNGAGQTGFIASLTTGTGSPAVVVSGATANATGLWLGTPGNTNLVLRQNDTVTPLDPAGTIRVGSFSASGTAISDAGSYIQLANLQGTVTTGTTSGNDQVMLTNRNGSMEVLARRGDQAVGAATGEFYRTISGTPGINAAGRVVFTSSLRNAAGTQVSSGALFTDNAGSMTMAARGGSAMPAIQGVGGAAYAGQSWGAFMSDTVINSAGTVAFKDSGITGPGITVGTNDSAIFTRDSSGVFASVVRQGDVAPVGQAIDGTNIFFNGFQSGLAMNSHGTIVFTTLLRGFNVNGLVGNNLALFAADTSGSIATIARTGQPFQVAPGDIRTITGFQASSVTGGQDGKQIILSDNNVLSFSLSFSDGTSGVFTAHIPAPGALPMVGLAGLVAMRRRR